MWKYVYPTPLRHPESMRGRLPLKLPYLTHILGGIYFDPFAARAIMDLVHLAEAAKVQITTYSGYRSWDDTEKMIAAWHAGQKQGMAFPPADPSVSIHPWGVGWDADPRQWIITNGPKVGIVHDVPSDPDHFHYVGTVPQAAVGDRVQLPIPVRAYAHTYDAHNNTHPTAVLKPGTYQIVKIVPGSHAIKPTTGIVRITRWVNLDALVAA